MNSHATLLAMGDFLQWATVPLSLSAYLPQWFALYKNRSSANMSLHAWTIWLLSSCFTIFYAAVQSTVPGGSRALLFTSVIGGLFIVTTIVLIFRYRDQTLSPD